MNDRETISVDLNVLAEALPPVPENFRDSRYVFLANTHPAGQLALLENFPQRKLVVCDTMDLWIQIEQDLLRQVLGKVDGFVLNDSEARQLTGETNVVRAADAILALGPTFVVIKKGEHGALLFHRDGIAALPAYPARDVVDPTGAGDTFASGMMGYIAAQDDTSFETIKTAIGYGTVVASFTIESFSVDRLRALSRQEIDARFEAYCAMMLPPCNARTLVARG